MIRSGFRLRRQRRKWKVFKYKLRGEIIFKQIKEIKYKDGKRENYKINILNQNSNVNIQHSSLLQISSSNGIGSLDPPPPNPPQPERAKIVE
uniref:Uncharacterized protein n=1 Tax=Meloidogyne enterolobii TaxID=390850 RepID=A0A6V7W7J0_MELEN|nr:unnamed protein product [Meloidogyne enterolobii]